MESREIKITLETARRWYALGGELKEIALGAFTEKELIGYRLPKTWEEYRTIRGDEGERVNATLNFAYTSINRAFTDYHDTEKHIALMKLHLLRDEYRQGWKPNWTDNGEFRCGIKRDDFGYIRCYINTQIPIFLTFQDVDITDKFLNNFRELIKEAGDLI